MNRVFILCGGLLCWFAFASNLVPGVTFAQSKPFPYNGGYVAGFVPTNISADDVRYSYEAWKAAYLRDDCGGGMYRVDFGDNNSTVSEGQGYGMVLTAYFGDKAEFDGLWKFVQKNLNTNGLMGWHVTCSGFTAGDGGSASASDGDEDIAFALIAAVDQWGDEYRESARTFLTAVKDHDLETCQATGRNMVRGGDWGGGCATSNTSYWMPGYYRVFAEFTGDAFWSKAADDAIAVYLLGRDASTGLIGNEVDENGNVYNGQTAVNYNGCRIPWREVLDYLWYGTAGAKDITDKLTDFASSIGPENLVDGYNTDGTPSAAGQWTGLNAWAGSWACGAMSKSQQMVDTFADYFISLDDLNGGYYGATLRPLYLLELGGYFWKPGAAGGGGGGGAGGESGGAGQGSGCGSAGTGNYFDGVMLLGLLFALARHQRHRVPAE